MNETTNMGLLGQDGDEEEQHGVQYLTFLLNGEQYGLSILSVQEIRGWESVTRVPNSPHFVKGVVNIRAISCRCLIFAGALVCRKRRTPRKPW